MNKSSGIYQINMGLWYYIGSSNDLRLRQWSHRNYLKLGTHHNQHMQRRYTKHGLFTWTILEYCPEDQLKTREDAWLKLNTGQPHCMNIALEATAPMRGRTHTQQTRDKLRLRPCPPITEHTRQLQSEARTKYWAEKPRPAKRSHRGKHAHIHNTMLKLIACQDEKKHTELIQQLAQQIHDKNTCI